MGGTNSKGESKEISDKSLKRTSVIYIGKLEKDPKEDYTTLNFLGEGSFSNVYEVKNNLNGQIRAMKIIKKTSSCSVKEDMELFNEINILRKFDHPNIMKIYEFYSLKYSYNIILELCSLGDLYAEIVMKGPFPEQYCAYVMYQILSAINYCHEERIIHRDLKPENIYISKRERGYPLLKIGDFGTAKMFEKGVIESKLVGTSYYVAPEVLKKSYNEKCDIWSCGVILYILLSKKQPFSGETEKDIIKKVISGKYDLTSSPFDKISKECKDLIMNLIMMDPKKRLSAEQALNHPWFKKYNAKELNNEIRDERIIDEFIKNLKTYKSDSIIQETALAYLVHNYSHRKDIDNATRLFNKLDLNGDGKITKNELYKAFKQKSKSKSLEKDVDIIFNNLDGDKNGYLQFNEFIRAAINKESFLEESVLRFAFNYFDKDKSGEICFDEIKEIFSESISKESNVDEKLKKIMSEVDSNGDGKICFKEFSSIMQKLLKKSIN